MWLHHTVLFDTTQPDPACPKSNVSRIFASGNERTPVDLTDNGAHKTGLYVSPTTEFSTLVELMNGASEAREAILSITFEYVPGVPAGFKKTTMLWLDVGGCYKSSDMPGYENALFEYASEPLVGNVAGTIVFTGGHLHDGGTHVDILKNGNLVCNSTASYGETAGYLDGNKATKGMPHVSSMVTCLSAGTLEPGEAVSLVAHYDTKEHLAMKEMDGTISPVMGIAMLYIMVD
ncbi:hypothetical protein BU16DRAFT_584159 [Lophium mytilinum]|uniref:Uncharacterized protein n=1 Tax=Lophium mytilinum TaxID=390894 RepID=A0A6A6QJW7_9PEZI|nr:hypothetical protein BU16DRAFT_584159 [Lophium mytilinum]